MSFTDEENEFFSECVESVGSEFSITKSKDGSTYSTTARCSMKMSIPVGGDFRHVWDWQRIQMTNKLRNDYENNRLKTPLK